jgi:hypothetical protein
VIESLYVSATKQDTGKTTTTVGLADALRGLGHDVGYMKPVGQRYVEYEGQHVDEDVVLMCRTFGLADVPADMNPITVTRGFTEEYIFSRDVEPMERRIFEAYQRLRAAHDMLVVEGTGHAGVGSCLDLSNARVAELLAGRVVIVTGGGIGRAIDEVALSLNLFAKHGVEVLGVILNKVWPEKLERIRRAAGQGLANLGTRLLGVVPYSAVLASPRMEQVVAKLGAEVLCGCEALDNRIDRTVVAAMVAKDAASYIGKNTLVITPGDRVDNILLTVCPRGGEAECSVSGLVLTGGFDLSDRVVALLKDSGLPVALCREDTYTVAARAQEAHYKVRPGDADKIAETKRLIRENIDVPGLLDLLEGGG